MPHPSNGIGYDHTCKLANSMADFEPGVDDGMRTGFAMADGFVEWVGSDEGKVYRAGDAIRGLS
jgi:hypothetical protein